MSMLTLSAAARALFAVHTGPDAEFGRVVTDSRAVRPGDLFVALKGERFDAHDFVADVLSRGAAGALVRCDFDLPGASLVKMADTRIALGQLGAAWRARFTLPLAGITGSNGKTTVKEMLRAILTEQWDGAAVLATEGNLNNDIGMPLTLLRLNPAHRAAVIEMGMNHHGELTYLSGLARPTVALVNNAQRAHVGHFGSVADVARAKAEIFAGLADDGVAVINADDPNAALFRAAAGARRVVSFGLQHGDVRAESVRLDAGESRLRIATPAGEFDTVLAVPGEHMVRNALAATAVALQMDVRPAAIARGLAAFGGVKGRLARKTAANGAAVIDDSYNANPDSVRAAIDVLAAQPGEKWLVFGDIGELGEAAPALHREIGEFARASGIDRLLTLGENAALAAAAFGPGATACAGFDTLAAALAGVPADATVLVKGSRFMKMERAVDVLTRQET